MMIWASRFLLAALFVCLSVRAHAVVAERLDLSGDPLPAGALARMGTTRLRHTERINDVAFHPDGKTLISVGEAGDVNFWDAATGKHIRRHRYGDTAIRRIEVSPDGRRFLVVDSRGSVIIAETETARRLYALSDVARLSVGAVFSPAGDSIALSIKEKDGETGGVELWRMESAGLTKVWSSEGQSHHLIFSPDGACLAVSEDAAIRLLSAETGEAISEPLRFPAQIKDFDVSPSDASIAVGLYGGVIEVWRPASSGESARKVWSEGQPHGGQPLSTVRFSPDGTKLTSTGADRFRRIWNAGDGRKLREFGGLYQNQTCWSPDGKTIAHWKSGAVLLQDAETGADRTSPQAHFMCPERMQFVDDGRRLVTVSPDESIRVWDTDTGRQLHAHAVTGRPEVYPVAGTSFVFIVRESGTSLLDAESGEHREWIKFEDANEARPELFDSDKNRLLTVTHHEAQKGEAGRVKVKERSELVTWRLPDGERLGAIEVAGEVELAKFLPDGERLGVVARNDDRQRLLFAHLDGSSEPQEIVDEEYARSTAMSDIAISPTGDSFALARGKRGVQMLKLPSGKVSHEWPRVSFPVRKVDVSSDGRRVLVVGGSSHVWEIPTGSRLCLDSSTEAWLSPDGKLFASSASDGTIELRDVDTQRRLTYFPGHGAELSDVQFSPDGKRLVSTAGDSTALCWSLDPEDWPSIDDGPPALADLWRQLGEHEADPAYDAAWQMVQRSSETLPFLTARLPREVVLPAVHESFDGESLRYHRAAYVLQQIEGDAAENLLDRFRRAAPPHAPAIAAKPGAGVPAESSPSGLALRLESGDLFVSNDGGAVLYGNGPQCQWCDPATLRPFAPLPVTGALCAVSHDGRFCLTLPKSYGVPMVWEVATYTVVSTLGRHYIGRQAVFSDDGRLLLACSNNGDITVLDLLKSLGRVRTRQREVDHASIAPNGRTLALYDSKSASVVDVAFGNTLWELSKFATKAPPQYSSNGGYLAAPLEADIWGIHEAETGRLWKQIPLSHRLVALSPRLATFIAADEAGKLQVYETATNRPVWDFATEKDSRVDYLPDGRRIVLRSSSGSTTVWDLASIAASRNGGESVGEQLERLWPDLARDDAQRGMAAVFAYAAAGDAAVDHLRVQLPKHLPDRDEVRRLVSQLEDDRFDVRANATRRLIAAGVVGVAALNEALENSPSVELRMQIERITKLLPEGDGLLLRRRARMILDQIDTPAATALGDELRSELPDLVDEPTRAAERDGA